MTSSRQGTVHADHSVPLLMETVSPLHTSMNVRYLYMPEMLNSCSRIIVLWNQLLFHGYSQYSSEGTDPHSFTSPHKGMFVEPTLRPA